MTTQRLLSLRASALTAHRNMTRKGYVRRQTLPRVTLDEHKWLCEHKPGIARFTRCFEYSGSEFISDVNRPGPAKNPVIREFWVGARSQALSGQALDTEIEEATGEDMPAGFKKSQAEQEDQAEITELMTLTYSDPLAYEHWIHETAAADLAALVRKKPRLKKHGAKLLQIIEKNLRLDHPSTCMVEDPESGELRPIRPGDCITTVRGSNDDLDALFLEEADDPREQNDFSADGHDHRYSDRFRANTELEESFFQDREHRIPNSALPEGLRWSPDDLTVRRAAQSVADRIIAGRPSLEPLRLQITDEAEENIRRQAADIKFGDEGKLTHGYFVDRKEFFASIEAPFLRRKMKPERRCNIRLSSGRNQTGFKPAKDQPLPIDWSKIPGSGCSSLQAAAPIPLKTKPTMRWLEILPNGSILDKTNQLADSPALAPSVSAGVA